MLDVFFCTCPEVEQRRELASKMLAWWEDVPGIRLHVLTPESVGVPLADFNRYRRLHAELNANDWAYIVADDDCELEDAQMIWKGVDTLALKEDFAILSAFPTNCNISRWQPFQLNQIHTYTPYEDLEVMEHVSVGGIRFTRTDCMTKGWPEPTGLGYDNEHCHALRISGYRVGYLQHVRMHHHGEGASTLCFPALSKSH